MARGSIFISYSADDPDWPAEQVRDLAIEIGKRNCSVFLDQFHLEQAKRRLSDAEWIAWMEGAHQDADHVLCLCSPRYLQASRRELSDDFGRGVAMESLDIIHRLYQNKGHNKGWVWTLFKSGHARRDVVPGRLLADCPFYVLPENRDELLIHLGNSGGSAPEGGSNDAESGFAPDPLLARSTGADRGSLPNLVRHKRATAERLVRAPSYWKVLTTDPEVFDELPPDSALATPAALVDWLVSADVEVVRESMWATRRALESANRTPASTDYGKANREAAVALYLLAAARLVDLAAPQGNGLHSVPHFGGDRINAHLYCAVISTALAGGQLRLEEPPTTAAPRPANTYGVRLEGDNVDTLFERALYNEVFQTPDAVTQALLDSPLSVEPGGERDKLLARFDTVRKKNREALTLVIHGSSVPLVQRPSLACQLDVPVFLCGDDVSVGLMGLTPGALVSEIREFWLEVGRTEPYGPGFQSHDGQREELDALLVALRSAVSDLTKSEQKVALLEHVDDLSAAAKSPGPDRSGRAKRAVEGIETLAKLGESSEKLAGMAIKVYEFLRPWL